MRGLGEEIGAAQGVEPGLGVMGTVRLDDVSDGVGEPVARGGPAESGAAEAAEVEVAALAAGAAGAAGVLPGSGAGGVGGAGRGARAGGVADAPGAGVVGAGVAGVVASALNGHLRLLDRRTGSPGRCAARGPVLFPVRAGA